MIKSLASSTVFLVALLALSGRVLAADNPGQEHERNILFAQALLGDSQSVVNCAGNGDPDVMMSYSDLTKAAIGSESLSEQIFRTGSQDLVVKRIESFNDSWFAPLGTAIGELITFGLNAGHEYLLLPAGKYFVAADFKTGTTELLGLSCFTYSDVPAQK